VWKELVFGGHLFAMGSVSVILMCAAIFLLPVNIEMICISYLLFYIIYLNDYSKGADVDEMTNSGRASYLQSRGSNSILINLSCIALFGLLLYSKDLVLIITGISILVLGLLYGNYFKDLTKKIVGFKNFYVAAVWAFMVIFFFMQQSAALSYGALMLASFVFLRMMNLQIMFDMRDMTGDREEGLLTFPVIFGLAKNMKVLKFNNLISVFFMFLCVLSGMLPLSALLIIAVAYYAGKCINNISSQDEQLCYIFAACEPILWFPLVFVGNLFLNYLDVSFLVA
jgi:4-hydroxybenzoate polyprenyltransferase